MKGKTLYRIPSMDGLRAISVLFVITSHSNHLIKDYIDIGNIGVRMFFIISSYLITGILFRDAINQRFNLRKFYFKRIMRTFPAFYFYLVIVGVFLILMGMFDWSQFWRAPVYLENYHPRNEWTTLQWFVGHSWSLAVEEQFYLLIAALFFVYYKDWISSKGVVKFLVGIIVLVPLIRLGYMRLDSVPSVLKYSIHRSFETVCDSLAIGALGYLLKDWLKTRLARFFNWPYLLIAFLVILLTGALNSPFLRELFGYSLRYIYNIIGIFLMHISMLFILLFGMEKPKGTLFLRIINTTPFVFIGLLSYSIYLWQQPWLYSWNTPLVVKYIGIFVMSLLSYYLVEKPFLSWRDKLMQKVLTADKRNL